jgi:hypothetical protein
LLSPMQKIFTIPPGESRRRPDWTRVGVALLGAFDRPVEDTLTVGPARSAIERD